MKRIRCAATAVSLILAAAGCSAQTYATDPLIQGRLIVWVVSTDPPRQPNADQVRRTLHTSTAGSFGRNAGDVGQTAGSYGTSTSQVGRGISSTAAGDAGTTAGSFGQTVDTIAAAGNPPQAPQFEPATLSPGGQHFAQELQRSFPGLQLSVVPVRSVDLQERFAALDAQAERPDVLLDDAALVARNPLLAVRTLAALGVSSQDELRREAPVQKDWFWRREWLLLRDAPHPAEARAFVVWLRDGHKARAEQNVSGNAPDNLRSLATGAAESLLRGTAISQADPTMVAYVPGVARRMALRSATDEVLADLQVQVNILSQAANERLAVFGLRAIAGSTGAFGVVYPMVVLRRGEDGRWTVLHVTGDVHAPGLVGGVGPLQPYTEKLRPEKLKAVHSVVLAAPTDGDTRAGIPDLWWDDPGDAEELVVEWSRNRGDAHLLYVPDTGPRLRVRVQAAFADTPGEYRWRVWSVGAGGVLSLSPWRRMIVLP